MAVSDSLLAAGSEPEPSVAMRNRHLSPALRDYGPAVGPVRRPGMPGPGDPIPTHRKERQESSGARARPPLALDKELLGFALLDWTISLPAPPEWHCSLCPMPEPGNGCEPKARSLSTPMAERLGIRSWTIGWLSDSGTAGTQINIRSCNARASTLTA